MKGPGGNEENMVGLDHAVLRVNRRALYNRKEVSLNSLS